LEALNSFEAKAKKDLSREKQSPKKKFFIGDDEFSVSRVQFSPEALFFFANNRF